MTSFIRYLAAAAFVLAVGGPVASWAESCPATVMGRCTNVRITGKRWVDGLESPVSCTAGGGHGVVLVPRSDGRVNVRFGFVPGEAACDALIADLFEVESIGLAERRASRSGKAKNDCVFTTYDSARTGTADPLHFTSIGGTYGFAAVSESDARLFPSGVKGSLVHRTESVDGPVSFIGTMQAKGCSAYFTD